jgi:DNA-binding NarL/FixJ family response regulator
MGYQRQMSDRFYEATQVIMDGRLSRIFNGPRVQGRSTRIRLDQNPQIVEAVVSGSRKGYSPKQIARGLNISASSVLKVKNLFRDRWEGVNEENA